MEGKQGLLDCRAQALRALLRRDGGVARIAHGYDVASCGNRVKGSAHKLAGHAESFGDLAGVHRPAARAHVSLHGGRHVAAVEGANLLFVGFVEGRATLGVSAQHADAADDAGRGERAHDEAVAGGER